MASVQIANLTRRTHRTVRQKTGRPSTGLRQVYKRDEHCPPPPERSPIPTRNAAQGAHRGGGERRVVARRIAVRRLRNSATPTRDVGTSAGTQPARNRAQPADPDRKTRSPTLRCGRRRETRGAETRATTPAPRRSSDRKQLEELRCSCLCMARSGVSPQQAVPNRDDAHAAGAGARGVALATDETVTGLSGRK